MVSDLQQQPFILSYLFVRRQIIGFLGWGKPHCEAGRVQIRVCNSRFPWASMLNRVGSFFKKILT